MIVIQDDTIRAKDLQECLVAFVSLMLLLYFDVDGAMKSTDSERIYTKVIVERSSDGGFESLDRKAFVSLPLLSKQDERGQDRVRVQACVCLLAFC